MRVLALETTTAHGSLAWLEPGRPAAVCDLEAGRYSTQLFAAMEALARQAGHPLADVGGFAVASGPGSFTGVRIGLTAVKGLAEVWRKPAVAVSTLAAVAVAAQAAGADPRPMAAALDAARGEVYFRLVAGAGAADGGQEPGEEIASDQIESLEAFCRRLAGQPALRLATPHPALAAACAARLGPALEARTILVPPRLAPAVASAAAAALAALSASASDSALRLDANYVRRSDAEIFAAPPARA
ncbi:MAG: tRNA (adenosine(37)-N6)-threonylcarbamoyltransferase complex dimerization subunit type 1 TsaB [Terriglobales bacterium]